MIHISPREIDALANKGNKAAMSIYHIIAEAQSTHDFIDIFLDLEEQENQEAVHWKGILYHRQYQEDLDGWKDVIHKVTYTQKDITELVGPSTMALARRTHASLVINIPLDINIVTDWDHKNLQLRQVE